MARCLALLRKICGSSISIKGEKVIFTNRLGDVRGVDCIYSERQTNDGIAAVCLRQGIQIGTCGIQIVTIESEKVIFAYRLRNVRGIGWTDTQSQTNNGITAITLCQGIQIGTCCSQIIAVEGEKVVFADRLSDVCGVDCIHSER